ncbi:MAG TPA: DUF3298 domain-containing protein [Anaerolineales bacterium]|nr:DUF3298 domain-containing protein [Anaerolineales bacterium]
MKSINMHRFLMMSLALGLMACDLVTPSPTIAPPLTPPAQTQVPLSAQVTLSFVSFKEESQSPTYSINAQIPKLIGSEDARVRALNKQVNDLIQQEIEYFRENIIRHMPLTPLSNGSFFEAQYTLVFQSGDLWSFKFNFTGYADGAAHPYHYSTTLNYDLEQGGKLSFDQLFLPDANYLEVISSYCIAELSKRDIGFYAGFEQGAEPIAENYRNWNISNEGLMITFDEYQVAPYAAGPQIVIVPYPVLAKVVDPQGPLGRFIR